MFEANHATVVDEYIQVPLPNYYPPASVFINSLHPISSEAKAFVDQKTFFCTLSKGKMLYREGQICLCVFIINKGALRGFIRDGKKEITTWISIENEMVTAIGSFFLQTPSFENIQAIEDCELTGFCYDDLQYAYEHFPETNIAGRKLLEIYYRDAEERAYISKLSSAKSRYADFLTTKPHLLNRIPLKYIASFLGMTIETLSRLRNTMSKRPKAHLEPEKIIQTG